MFRVVLIGLLIGAVLVAQKRYDVIHRSGLLSYCHVVQGPLGDPAVWKQCHRGYLLGARPDLTGDGCTSQVRNGRYETWRCTGAPPSNS